MGQQESGLGQGQALLSPGGHGHRRSGSAFSAISTFSTASEGRLVLKIDRPDTDADRDGPDTPLRQGHHDHGGWRDGGVGGGRARTPFFLSWTSAYVLALYTLLAACTSIFWITFSTVPRLAERYYAVGDATIDLWLNWGCIIYLPVVPLAAYMMAARNGLRRSILAGCWLSALGCAVRVVPSVLEPRARVGKQSLAMVHIGQILISAAGPFAMVGPSRLSAVWFAPEHRATATSIGYLAQNVGVAVAFLLGPFVVDGDPDRIARLLFLELGLGCFLLLCALVYCPDHPAVPPSKAVATAGPSVCVEDCTAPAPDDSGNGDGDGDTDGGGVSAGATIASVSGFLRQLGRSLGNRQLAVLVVLGGLEAGATSGWTGLLPQILQDSGFSSKFAGICGFACAAGQVAGNLASGLIADRFFRRNLKALLVLGFYFAALGFACFTFTVNVPFLGGHPALPSSEALILVAVILACFCQGSCDPLFYELSAEVSFPMKEGTSAGLITFSYNVTNLVMLFIAPYAVSWMNTAMVLIMALCGILVWLLVKQDYLRSEAEPRREVYEGINH